MLTPTKSNPMPHHKQEIIRIRCQIVEMASKNYKFCKERLEGAQKKLNSILEDPTIEEIKTTDPNSDSQFQFQFQEDDSDMPF